MSGLARKWKACCAPDNALMSPTAVSQQESPAEDSLTELWSEVEQWTHQRLSDQRGATTTRRQWHRVTCSIHHADLQLLVKTVYHNRSSAQCDNLFIAPLRNSLPASCAQNRIITNSIRTQTQVACSWGKPRLLPKGAEPQLSAILGVLRFSSIYANIL